MRVRLLALALLAAAASTGCATSRPAAAPDGAMAAQGRTFAERACAGCHAIEPVGDSPNPDAPPFRLLAARRSDAGLTQALHEISRNGHIEMPPIYVTPDEMAGVVAYMRSLTGRPA